jgi:antitoxin ParD1/3/4
MTTVTMNISLPEHMKSFVDTRMQAKGYSSTSEYVRDLVRRDVERQAEERFVALIQQGMASGPGRPWEEIRADFDQRLAKHRQSKRKAPAGSRKAA